METQGKVKNVRRDRKGIQLDTGEWYSSFNDTVNCNVGDEVKIEFIRNGNFNNFDEIEVVNKTQTSTKSDYADSNKYKQASVMISYVKDLVVAGKIDIKEFTTYAHRLMALQEGMVNNPVKTEAIDDDNHVDVKTEKK